MTTSIDKKQGFGMVRGMLELILLKRMLRILFNEFNIRDIPQTREQFVKHYTETKRAWWLYGFDNSAIYKNRIDFIIRTEIPP